MLKPDGARKEEKQKDEIYTGTNTHTNIYSAKKKICTLLYDSIIASLTLMSNVVTTKKNIAWASNNTPEITEQKTSDHESDRHGFL